MARNHVLPEINEPVRRLKERFTLNGRPIPATECAKRLGLDVSNSSGSYVITQEVGDENRTWIFNPESQSWEYAKYQADAENFDTSQVSGSEVLKAWIRIYYELGHHRKNQMPAVLASLSARLLPLLNENELSAFKQELLNRSS